jgi:hypothetical protein
MPCYFFSGNRYIRVTRGQTGPGEVDLGYPAPISNWGWGSFGANGIDASLNSGPVDYFFSGNRYIRVTRGNTGPGTVDPGYPAPISNWGWGSFGANGIDAALYSGTKCYFFSGKQYIRVTRGNTGPGTVDPGYPAPISNWGWGGFGANGIDAALYSGPVCYFFSGSQYIRVTRGDTGPGTVDPGYPAPMSNWGWGEFGASKVKAALFSGTDSVVGANVPAPKSGLGSNSNYILYNNCKPITGLTITINVTQDIVCQSASGATKGFGFQLNAYSPKNELSAWQQYVMALFGSEIVGAVDNWPISGPNIINSFFNMVAMPSAKIPAGYQLKIALQNDAKNNITGAIYSMIDNHGKVLANVTKVLTSLSGVTASDLAPIIAFELNLVGPVNSESAVLSSGAGSIIYEATTPLTVLSSEPSCAESGYITAETANSIYGVMNAGPSVDFSQSFNITTAAPMIRKQGKIRPSFIVPPGTK